MSQAVEKCQVAQVQDFPDTSLDYFALLPDEVVVQIFAMLENPEILPISLVCKRWNDLAKDKEVWKAVYLYEEKISLKYIKNVLERGAVLLDISFCDILHTKKGPVRHCQLQSLTIESSDFFPNDFWYILRCCPALKRLSMHGSTIYGTMCSSIGQMKDLQKLEIFGTDHITPCGLATILQGCQRLKRYVVEVDLGSFHATTVTNNVAPTLEELYINERELDYEHFGALAARCQNITVLHIASSKINEQSLTHFLNMKKLVRLSLCCFGISIESLSLLRRHAALKKLTLTPEWLDWTDLTLDFGQLAKALPGVDIEVQCRGPSCHSAHLWDRA